MVKKLTTRILVTLVLGIAWMAACNTMPSQATPLSQGQTGIEELDTIISTVLNGSTADLLPLLEFTQTSCTLAEGLGGPPKCVGGEKEGTPMEVLPFLGPEGHFIRKEDIGSWQGLEATELYAAYQVSNKAYSEKDYPAGNYALVFIDSDSKQGAITLQVRNGRIIRIDYLFGYPPEIPQENVVKFLTAPIEVEP